MELVVGQTLAARLSAGPMPVKEVLDIGIQVADALDAAHAQGIIHRDIKPAKHSRNQKGQAKFWILVSRSLYFSDEVVSFSAFADHPGQVTQQDQGLMGTIPYMSPEQARREPMDGRSDLFSFGLVLYEMTTGCQAFKGRSDGIVLDAVLNFTPVSPSQINRVVPPQLEQIINRALEKDPALRYQTARDLKSELQRLKRDVDSGISSGTSIVPGPASQNRASPPQEVGFAAAGVALLGAAFNRVRRCPANPGADWLLSCHQRCQQKEFPDSFYPGRY